MFSNYGEVAYVGGNNIIGFDGSSWSWFAFFSVDDVGILLVKVHVLLLFSLFLMLLFLRSSISLLLVVMFARGGMLEYLDFDSIR